MKAVVITSPGKASLVEDRPKPALRDDYLLVKTRCVAVNPTDWKHADITQTPGILLGCDYAGTVEEVGPAVTKPFKKGDRVMGFVHGGNSLQPEDGAFAEYIVVKGDIQAHIPDHMSFEEAATFGVGITSVGQGLYQALGLPLPNVDGEISTSAEQKPILIYGGSTCTGVLGIQFAKLSGFSPIATASPHNFDLLTSFGAAHVFDYGEVDSSEEIRDVTEDGLKLCWDTISTRWTTEFCAKALSSGGGKIATLHPVLSPRAEVEVASTLAYTIFGEDWGMGAKKYHAKIEDFVFGKMWWALAEKLISQRRIRPAIIKVGADGLKGVVEGLQQLRDAKVSGHKLVYRVDETP